MNDDHINNGAGETFNEETGEYTIDERENPPVAGKDNRGVYIILIAMIIVIVVIAALFLGTLTRKDAAPVTESIEQVFHAPPTSSEPVIFDDPAPVEPPAQDALKTSQAQPVPPRELSMEEKMLLQRQIQLQEDAILMVKEQEEERQRRLKSPLLVINGSLPAGVNSGFGATAQTASGHHQLNQSSNALNGTDAKSDTDFARMNVNASVPTVSATQLQNLDTLIAQGKMIPGILETAVSSQLPGMVRAITSADVYSFDGSTMLIPRGSRLVGQYRSAVKNGQSRVFVIWNRLIRPDGASVDIGSVGTDSLGRSGMAGDVDTHFMERFGASVMLSMIDGALDAAVAGSSNDTGSNVSIESSGSLSKSSEIALENSIKIAPTIHVPQGTRIMIFVGKDLDFTSVGGY